MTNLKTWLEDHPEWILRTDLVRRLNNDSELEDIIRNNEYAYITSDGISYKRLRDVPTFAGLKQVVKYNYKKLQQEGC